MNLTIIVACSENNVIGINNTLPWKLPNDLAYFKKKTIGGCILMGRKTYQSIGRPLPDRTNLVLTRNKFSVIPGFHYVSSLQGAKYLADFLGFKQLFVIGGETIYHLTLPEATTILLTRVHTVLEGDAFFPWGEFKSSWRLIHQEPHLADQNHPYPYTFYTYIRK